LIWSIGLNERMLRKDNLSLFGVLEASFAELFAAISVKAVFLLKHLEIL